MSKYVRLSDDKTKMTSPIMAVKPNPIKRIPEDEIHKYNWFHVDDVYPEKPEEAEMYYLERKGWTYHPDKKLVKVDYFYKEHSLDVVKSILVGRCNALRDTTLRSGIIFRGMPFDTKPETIQRISGAVLNTMVDPSYTIPWITDDNRVITLEPADIVALGQAFASYEGRVVMYCRQIKDQILASDDPRSIDFSSGWPSNEFESSDE